MLSFFTETVEKPERTRTERGRFTSKYSWVNTNVLERAKDEVTFTEIVEKPERTPTRRGRSTSRHSTVNTNIPEKAKDEVKENVDVMDDEDVRYKFPSPVPEPVKTPTKQNKNKRTESLNR